MTSIDRLRPGMRALVYEYGAAIVGEMIGDGYTDPDVLRPVLVTWRQRRQQKWLDTDYITARAGRSIDRAVGNGASS